MPDSGIPLDESDILYSRRGEWRYSVMGATCGQTAEAKAASGQYQHLMAMKIDRLFVTQTC